MEELTLVVDISLDGLPLKLVGTRLAFRDLNVSRRKTL